VTWWHPSEASTTIPITPTEDANENDSTQRVPAYKADNGPLTKAQLNQIKKTAPRVKRSPVCNHLFFGVGSKPTTKP
jgi:hypothetical protein